MENHAKRYRQEVEELLADIEMTILDLEENPGDTDAIHRLFRDFHTIKGSGAMFGFDEIAAFTHHVEAVLDVLREGKIAISTRLIDLILSSRDHIQALMEAGHETGHTTSRQSRKIIDALSSLMPEECLLPEEGGGFSIEDPSAPPPSRKGDFTSYRISFAPHKDIFKSGVRILLLLQEIRDLGSCFIRAVIQDIPILEDIDPEHCYLRWEIFLTTTHPQNAIEDVFIFVAEESRLEIVPVIPGGRREPPEDLFPRLGEILIARGDASPEEVGRILNEFQESIGGAFVRSGIVAPDRLRSARDFQRGVSKCQKQKEKSSIRISSEKLDRLINLVGELIINQSHLTRSVYEIENLLEEEEESRSEPAEVILQGWKDILKPVENLERLTDSFRDCALEMRMIPIGTIFGGFRRLVRDLCGELGKAVDLVTEGAETALDKTVIERLKDPLMHLIRNCVSHGIRSPEVREKFGKSRRGKILLRAEQMGSTVSITIEDDGMGMDPALIRKKAVEKGLIPADANLTESQILYLIFSPGFSTADQVTQVSGRGVGMDVVKQQIDTLGGTVTIDNEKGKSFRVTLTLPLTLAIIEGLMIRAGENRFVLPIAQLEECLELTPEIVRIRDGGRMALCREALLPFVRLREIFDIKGAPPEIEHLVVARVEHLRVGIAADEILGNIQTVIKSLNRIYRDIQGISGATILGDGTVALIIDVPGLIRSTQRDDIPLFSRSG